VSWVVIVHTDPASTVALLEAAGLVVERAGVLVVPAYDPIGNGARGFEHPPTRHVLVVSNPAQETKAA
jgi:hypothetical protein